MRARASQPAHCPGHPFRSASESKARDAPSRQGCWPTVGGNRNKQPYLKCGMCEVGWLTLGVPMDAKTRAIVLIKYKPMIQQFKDAIAEEYRAQEKGRRPTQLPPILTREQPRYSKTSACQR